MLKTKQKEIELLKKYSFLFELIPLCFCLRTVITILSKNNEALDFLLFFSNQTQVWFPYGSFWFFLLKGVSNGLFMLCCFALLMLLCRVINIWGLIKRKKASFVLLIVFYSFDFLCVIIAFITSTNGPGTKYFGEEILTVVMTFIVTVLVWGVAFIIYKAKREINTGESKTGDGRGK